MKRPRQFTAAVQSEIMREYEAGGNLDTAADAAGVSRKTLASWLDMGEKFEAEIDAETLNANAPNDATEDLKVEIYDFLVAIRKARAKYLRGIRSVVQALVDPMDGQRPDAKVAMFLLQQTDAYKPKDAITTVHNRVSGITINRLPAPINDRILLPSSDIIDVSIERVHETES